MIIIIPWVLSITTGVMLWAMGNKAKWAPMFGIITQFLWFYYIWKIEAWGLMLGATIYLAVHIRNHIKWTK